MAITRKNRVAPQHLEEVVSTYGYTLASVARDTGIDRITLSKFRNHGQALKLEDARALLDWMRKNELWEDDADDDDDTPTTTRPTRMASALSAVFPSPTIEVGIAGDLDADTAAAAQAELNTIVRENDRKLALAADYATAIFFDAELSDDANAINEELRQGLAYEAVLRRVLAGSFKARYAERQAATHADLIAQQLLGHLPAAGATDPEPLADSSDENSVADAAFAGAARGEGPSPMRAKATVFG